MLVAGSKFIAVKSNRCAHCNLDLGDVTLIQDHDTSLGSFRYVQQKSEVLYISTRKISAENYDPETFDLDLWDVTLLQGYYMHLGHNQE